MKDCSFALHPFRQLAWQPMGSPASVTHGPAMSSHAPLGADDPGNRVRMYSFALSGDSLIVPGPLLTKKSPSVAASMPFHFSNTGSGLLWQLTRQTVLFWTIWVFGLIHVLARSPRPLLTI